MSTSNEFCDLHHHSESSLLDGYGSIDIHTERCKSLGHPAVAMTEHGTLRGFVALDAACKKHKIRPIYGCELYVTRDHKAHGLTLEQEASVTVGLKGKEATAAKKLLATELGVTENRHLIALAADEEGFRNLVRLVNTANRDGYYYRPRVDLKLLKKHSAGLWINSGCIGSVVAQSVLKGDTARALDDLEFFLDTFGERFSLEIQAHPIPEQEQWNRVAVQLSKDWGIPLVAANDSHYPTKKDYKTHDALVAIGHGVQIDDCDRMRYASDTFWLHSHKQQAKEFKRHHPYLSKKLVLAALERSAEIADGCRAELPRPLGVLLPKIVKKPAKRLEKLCAIGWKTRAIDARAKRRGVKVKEYEKRLAHELSVIRGKKFAGYFLIVHEIVEWAEKEGILATCRGSAAGSLVCYLLGVTSIDPLEHDLLFDRFLTPGRPDWPDVDLDFESERRHEVFAHLSEKYGEGHVARVSSIVRMAGRTAFRDSAKAHGIGHFEVDKVTSIIVDPVTREDRLAERDTIKETLETSPELRAFDDKYPGITDLAMQLEGHVRHVGVHAAAFICSPIALDDWLPVERRLLNGQPAIVTAYDYRDCEEVGLIKLDILGLKTLSVLADTMRFIEARTGKKPDLDELDLQDPKVLKLFTKSDLLGVFQFDTSTARAAFRGVKFRSFEDVVAMNAIIRPGPATSGLADLWRDRNAGKKTKRGPKLVEKICKDSLGVLIYQEQVMRILAEGAGFDPAEVGRIRKAVAKSKGVGFLADERKPFTKGAAKVGKLTAGEADKLWTQIEQFGAYSFGKGHAAMYAAMAFWCQYLKLKHPAEFFCALLGNEKSIGKAGFVMRDAARRGVKIEPPDVGHSGENWALRGGSLLTGLGTIKGVGEKACAELAAAQREGDFADLPDLLGRVNRRHVHKGVLVALAKAGALGALVPNVRWYVEHAEKLGKLKGLKATKKTKAVSAFERINRLLEESKGEPTYSREDTQALQLSVGISLGAHPLEVFRPMFKAIGRRDPAPCEIDRVANGNWVRGIVVGRKIGTARNEKWAKLEIEDEAGDRLTLRFGDAEYKAFRSVIDLGLGAVVAAWLNVSMGRNGKSVRAAMLIDLLAMRAQWRENPQALTWQQRSFCRGKLHPAASSERHDAHTTQWHRNKRAPVLVLSRRSKKDRTGALMAWVRVDPGAAGGIDEVVFFGSIWSDYMRFVQPGAVIELQVKRGKGLIAKRASLLRPPPEQLARQ